MLHSEKPYGTLMHCRCEIVQEVGDDGAHKIKANAQHKLYVGKGGGKGSYPIVKPVERPSLQPSPVAP